MAGGAGELGTDNTVYASYAAALASTPDTMRAHAAYASVLSGVPDTMRIHAAYMVVMVPVNPKPRRTVTFISDG